MRAIPIAPIVVVSPVLRPDAEDEPNKLGATLADIRHAIESVDPRPHRRRATTRWPWWPVRASSTPDHLGDGIHPDDEGHKRIAATVAKALSLAIKTAKDAAGADAPSASASPRPR